MFVNQSNNEVGGDVVAGDKKVYINTAVSAITSLYERLRANEDQSEYVSEIADQLRHYCSISTDGDVRGLEDKLSAADRKDILQIASRLKETATKIIMKWQTSPIAQDILTHLLCGIYTNFILHITPAVQACESRSTVDALISEKVVLPAMQILGENDLHLTEADVLGLIFFLGGNCHLRWDRC